MAITLDFAKTTDLEKQLIIMQAKCDRWLEANRSYAECLLAEHGDNKEQATDGPVRISVQLSEDGFSLVGRVHLHQSIEVADVCDDSLNSMFFEMGLYSDTALQSLI